MVSGGWHWTVFATALLTLPVLEELHKNFPFHFHMEEWKVSMRVSKFSLKLPALFFEQREKYNVEALAGSFSGVKLWFVSPLLPPFSLQSCGT